MKQVPRCRNNTVGLICDFLNIKGSFSMHYVSHNGWGRRIRCHLQRKSSLVVVLNRALSLLTVYNYLSYVCMNVCLLCILKRLDLPYCMVIQVHWMKVLGRSDCYKINVHFILFFGHILTRSIWDFNLNQSQNNQLTVNIWGFVRKRIHWYEGMLTIFERGGRGNWEVEGCDV